MCYPALPAHQPILRPVSRRGRPFRPPCAPDPADPCRTPSSCGPSSYSSFAHLSWAGGHALDKAASDVILRAAVVRSRENASGFAELDKITEIHKGREIRNARGLLHVMGHDRNRVVILQLVDQLFDLGCRNRIERGTRLIE